MYCTNVIVNTTTQCSDAERGVATTMPLTYVRLKTLIKGGMTKSRKNNSYLEKTFSLYDGIKHCYFVGFALVSLRNQIHQYDSQPRLC